MVLLSVTLDFFQEYKANAAADKLRESVSVRTTVLRNGVAVDVSIQEVVHGDVALMSAGDLIPADGLVLEAKDFFVNQSTLTGEAFPVKKKSRYLAKQHFDNLPIAIDEDYSCNFAPNTEYIDL